MRQAEDLAALPQLPCPISFQRALLCIKLQISFLVYYIFLNCT